MQLKIYDVLSSLIPGTLVLAALIPFYVFMTGNLELVEQKLSIYKDISGILTSVFIVASYLTGYLIHGIGSWIEPVFWFFWRGRPSKNLFVRKNKRIVLINSEKILNFLIEKTNEDTLKEKSPNELKDEDYRYIFQLAKYLSSIHAKPGIKERIDEFNNSYIFSRNILVACFLIILCCLILMIQGVVSWWLWIVFIPLFLMLWFRCRDRAFYYSREVLAGAYYSIENQGLS